MFTFDTVPPEDPFPIIEECVDSNSWRADDRNCNLALNGTSSVICSIFGYFPKVNLYFLHASKQMEEQQFHQWNNSDGTKNMSVTIQINPSSFPYICVASQVPGYDDQDFQFLVFVSSLLNENITSLGTEATTRNSANALTIGTYISQSTVIFFVLFSTASQLLSLA